MAIQNDAKLVSLAVRLYERLKSGNAVAKRMGISHSTAYRLLNAGGVDLPDRHGAEVQERKKKFNGDAAKKVAEDYAAGMSAKDLRQKYNASMWAIRTAASDAGVEMRGRGGRFRAFSCEEIREAVSLYESGWSQAKIAAKFGSSQITTSRMLRQSGCTLKDSHANGPRHGSWKGGRSKTTGGYITVWLDRADTIGGMADSQGRAMEHRVVMARALGRVLHENESVHHINGDRTDNRLSNLQLRFGKHGNGVAMMCKKCGSHEISYRTLD